MATDPRFLAESGRAVLTGNEILVKGCLEVDGGVHLLTGYPGSPVAGFFDVLHNLSKLLLDHGIRAFQANNEALAAAAINGSQMGAYRAVCCFKSVGLHLASDALALANLAGPHPQGGALVIVGDDPWCDSTQVPADSRFLFEHLRCPVVEPGSPQELKDWIDLSFKLSRAGGQIVGYVVTTAHADGGGTVDVRPNQYPEFNTRNRITLDTSKVRFEETVLLPPRTWQSELKFPERFARSVRAARELGINKIVRPGIFGGGRLGGAHSGIAPLGFITTGMGRPYLEHVLADVGLLEVFPILNMGLSYPADAELVREFAGLCKNIIVVEERRGFLESNIRDALFHQYPADAAEIAGRIYGKTFPVLSGKTLPGIPEARGLNPSLLAQYILPLIKAIDELPPQMRDGRLSAELDLIKRHSRPKLQVLQSVQEHVVARTPTFCPGCPHRDSSAALLDIRRHFADPVYMRKHHRMGTVDLVAHGDTGCYTMLIYPPTEQLMHNYSGMGLGGGTGIGIDSFINNKQIVFMGDGTFFHSGQAAISNSIKNGQNITYIILENGTTAMTGHQEHPGTEVDLLGKHTWLQDIEAICRSMAGNSPLTVVKLNPADRSVYEKTLEKTILQDGVKIVIANKECGITYHRKLLQQEREIIQAKGYLPRKTHMNITPEVCENCLECTKQTACPGLTNIDTPYGRKIDTDFTLCVNDGACERVRTTNPEGVSVKPCPSFEQVTILRKHRPRYLLPRMDLDKLPDVKPIHEMKRPGDVWRAHLSGVGGMGIGVVTAILVRAGHKEGYRIVFQDKKGLAIRNGGVFAQVTYVKDVPPDKPRDERSESPDPYPTTGAIPYGKADLLLGIDILEAARALDPRESFRIADKDRTCAVLNLRKQPTVTGLIGQTDFDPNVLAQDIAQQVRPEYCFARDLAEICERRLGSSQFANIMMLGVAYQMGLIPVSPASLDWAIKDAIPRQQRKNLKAFNIGRKLALEPHALSDKPQPSTWQELLTEKSRILRQTRLRGAKLANQFEQLVHSAVGQLADLPADAQFDLVLRLYDLLQYQNYAFASQYLERVLCVYRRDNPAHSWAATRAVIWNLAKVMLIKDEPYVAYLLTRYEKKQRDIEKYSIDLAIGDRIRYRHHTSPEFNIGPWHVRFKIKTRPWQLRLVKHMKWWRHLPGWHKRETGFRDWYISLLDRVNLSDDSAYEQALRILKSPEEVTGYREIRYPKQEAARQAAEAELARPAIASSAADASVIGALRQPHHV